MPLLKLRNFEGIMTKTLSKAILVRSALKSNDHVNPTKENRIHNKKQIHL